jgi:SAM-dependent methyltransferase
MATSAYDPDIYDAVYMEDASDVRYYLGLAKQLGGPVLELGAGTGRAVLPIARAGIDVVAVDNSPEMLARLQAKLANEDVGTRNRVRVIRGDMTGLRVEERFTLVQLPFRGFLHNLNRALQLACLKVCYQHLRPGGVIALDVFRPSLEVICASHGALAGVWRWTDDFPADGKRVILSEATTYDNEVQQLYTCHRYDVLTSAGTLERSFIQVIELAYLFPGEMRELLATAGFDDIRLAGDFEGGEVVDGSEIVVRATRR